MAFHLANVTILRFVQSNAKCPNPWHLKHLWIPLGMRSGLFGGGWLFTWAGIFYGVKGGGTIGL